MRTIPLKQNTKYLGLILDNQLTWHDHVQYINIKLSKATGILSKQCYYVSKSIIKTLFYSFFQPHIDYMEYMCSEIHCSINLNKHEKAIRTLSFAEYDTILDPYSRHLIYSIFKISGSYSKVNLNGTYVMENTLNS